jgi:superfamily II DNA or RNA helicase
MNIILRIYQEWATKAALKGLRGCLKRALVVLATGLGKTLTAAFITKKFSAKRTLFLVHNNFILKHAMDEFRRVFDENTKMAVYNGISKKGVKDAHIVFATWQTMGANLKQWDRNHFGLIIVDEAQHTEAYTYRPTVDYFTGAKLGITATPDRTDDTDIRDVFGQEVINITLEEAIARGWLPRIEYHVVTDESLDDDALQKIAAEIRKSKRRFTMAEVNRRIFIKKRDVEIARIINGYDEKAIVFCNSIRHAERMKKPLRLAATFHSEKGVSQKDTWDQNQATLDALKNGIIRRLCAVNAFNEGVNVPSIGLVAFCRVTGVVTIFRQQLGRGLRPGKDKLIVLDFVGNLERIQLVLAMMNRISDLHEEYTPKDGIEREGYIRQRFEVSGKGFEFTFSDKVVDLMKVLEHCERDLYSTWQEASKGIIKLGIVSKRDYDIRFRMDQHLPSDPERKYQDFPSWLVFLGKDKDNCYKTWQEAGNAARNAGITSGVLYRKFCDKDPRLPLSPHHYYSDFPDWYKFLGKERPVEKYKTWDQASTAVRALGISSQKEYRERSKEDLNLPADPWYHYDNFPGWPKFLGKV